MKYKEFYFILLLIIIIALAILKIQISNIERVSNCIYIPAVSKNGGVITEFCLKTFLGSGKVFIEIPSVLLDKYQLSFLIAKLAVCKITRFCNNYDYLFYTKEHFSGEGFSGTAGLATLILLNLYQVEYKQNVSVTGFILPNGLIFPVEGIQKKFEASKLKNLTFLAPSNYSKDIIQIYTILDITNYILNKNTTYSFEVPEKYRTTLKKIATEICKDINTSDINKLLESGSFYTAASLCFVRKSEKENIINTSLEILNKEISDFESFIEKYQCKTYICNEIKFQILLRINMSKEEENINRKYWRFYTAKGWYEILKEFENMDRKDTCKYVDEDYKIIEYLSNQELPEDVSCFEKREILSRIYYSFLSNTNFDINKFLDSVENYLNYLYNKNGFSITSYNYFVYGKDLINMGKINDGLLYILYAVNYAI